MGATSFKWTAKEWEILKLTQDKYHQIISKTVINDDIYIPILYVPMSQETQM